jgi:hypothetical protein
MMTKSPAARQPPKQDAGYGPVRLLWSLILCGVLAAPKSAIATTSARGFDAPLPDPESLAHAPATTYANLLPSQCLALVNKRGLPHQRVSAGAQGITTPLRLTDQLHGVKFVIPGRKSRFGLLDCRLLLALNDFAALITQYGVSEVRIDSFYRPRAHLPGRKKLSQHAFGLAMDLIEFKLTDGTTLNIDRDFQGTLGQPVCGQQAHLIEDTPNARSLRNLVCAIASSGIFHNTLTPNYNPAHHNHLHLDITPRTQYFGVH